MAALLTALGVVAAGAPAPAGPAAAQHVITSGTQNAPTTQSAPSSAAHNAAVIAAMRRSGASMFGSRGKPWPWWVGAGKRRMSYKTKSALRISRSSR